MYGAEEEDFGKRELHKLDTWVFDRVDKFFNKVLDIVRYSYKFYSENPPLSVLAFSFFK